MLPVRADMEHLNKLLKRENGDKVYNKNNQMLDLMRFPLCETGRSLKLRSNKQKWQVGLVLYKTCVRQALNRSFRFYCQWKFNRSLKSFYHTLKVRLNNHFSTNFQGETKKNSIMPSLASTSGNPRTLLLFVQGNVQN